MWGVDILGPFPTSWKQARWIIVAVDYFTKWVEAQPLSSISVEQVKKFYWRRIICRFGLPKYIVSDNNTQFASEKVVSFCKEKGIQNTFISVEHPQANGQVESANKVILKALKRRLSRKEEAWVAHLTAILWSYHTTPQSSTGEAPFTMVYGADAMIPAEVNPPSSRRETTTAQENNEALQENLDLIQEVRDKLSTLQRIRHEAKSRQKVQYKGNPKKIQRRRPSTEETNGKR
jgi:hypothetical protein